jgi:hemerythrin superfamily protein
MPTRTRTKTKTGTRARKIARTARSGARKVAKRARSAERSVAARVTGVRRSAAARRGAKTRTVNQAKRRNARAESAIARSRNPRALAMIEKDHRNVERLFREFDNASGRERKQDIALTICKELKVHAVLEEELFYPALAQAQRDKSDVGEALVEHSVVKGLIAKIEGMKPDDAWYDETVTVLKEMIEHHVGEEESTLFRQARRCGVNLDDLGLWMAQRKKQLRAEQGLPETEDLRLDMNETARLQELQEAGPVTRFVSSLASVASSITH